MSDFEVKDWTPREFGHVQGKEEMSSSMPQPRDTGFLCYNFVVLVLCASDSFATYCTIFSIRLLRIRDSIRLLKDSRWWIKTFWGGLGHLR